MTESLGGSQANGPKKTHRLRNTLIALGVVLVLLAGGVGIYAASLAQKFDSAEKIADPFPEETSRPPVIEAPPEEPVAQNILLLGSDTRGRIGDSLAGAGGSRSDTMMVVHIPADRQNIQVMSLMRDFWVDIPGRGEAKLNAALAYGGVPLAIQTIEGLLDSRIDHVAIVDFEGFKGVTDALGGVEVHNSIPFYRQGFSFDAGPIALQGDSALAYVRERRAFADGDYQRVRNQQLFIKGVMSKTLRAETLTNPIAISNLVGAVVPYLAVNEELNSAYAAGLAMELRDIRVNDVRFFTLPTLGTGNVGGQSIVRVDFDTLETIKEHLRADTLAEYEPAVQSMIGATG